MILDEILKNKRQEVAKRKELLSLDKLIKKIEEETERMMKERRDFTTALEVDRKVKLKLIAEIKRASPSAGILKKDLDEVSLAMTYELAKAAAISVVTDNKYFHGSLDMLRRIKNKVSLPILKKDFIIDEYQIYEGAYFGADAILLIASYLRKEDIIKYIGICNSLGISSVVEVHTENDLDKILDLDIKIIGINNRNLYTFNVDLKTTLRLKIFIPPDKIIISESGIKTRDDVKLLKSKGIDAILVGEELIKAADTRLKIKELLA